MTDIPNHKSKWPEILGLAICFGVAFLFVNYLHFQYLPVSVILYACLWDAAIATIVVLSLFFLFRQSKSNLLATELTLTTVASNLLIALYGVMGPTVIDRSLSLYIVNKIDQRDGVVAEDKMEDLFVREYLPEFRLIDVRMTEQVASGTVRIEDGCVYLTRKGKQLSGFVNWYRSALLPQKRVLMGEVTNQLTTPFKDAEQIVDTTCRNGGGS